MIVITTRAAVLRTVSVVLLAAVLVATSGCNALTDGNELTPPSRVTPVAVPTDAPTPTPVGHLAPGLTRDGLTDPNELVDAHAAVLANTSFTLREEWTLESPNGTVLARRVRTVRVEGDESYTVLDRTGALGPRHRETWSGTEGHVSRTSHDDATSYDRLPLSGSPHDEAVWEPGALFYRAFEPQWNPTVGRLDRNGTTLYHLDNIYPSGPSNNGITARIDPRGVVRNYSVYDPDPAVSRVPSATLSIRSVEITDIGTTTVERPAWYDRAMDRTRAANRTTAAG